MTAAFAFGAKFARYEVIAGLHTISTCWYPNRKLQITNIGTLRCSANLYVVVPAILELISVLFLITIFPKYNRIH
jgi:hypothetical protein